MGSLTKDGSLDVHSRGSSHSNLQFYCVVAGAEQATGTLQFFPVDTSMYSNTFSP